MSGRPVYWEEGLFLTPQHFQAADRHFRRGLQEVEDWFHPYNWGIRTIEFEAKNVSKYVFVLRQCEARFPDGTRLVVGKGCDVPSLSLNLRNAFPKGKTETTIFLAVPSFHLGEKNVEDKASSRGPRRQVDTEEFPDGEAGDGEATGMGEKRVDDKASSRGPRYQVDSEDCLDEGTGKGEATIKVLRPQARLLHSEDDANGYETLSILHLKRATGDGALPRVDLTKVPPLLRLDAWPSLLEQIQTLSLDIRGKIDQLSEYAVNQGISFRSQDVGDTERLLKLGALNEADPPLRAMAFTPGFTPLAVYVELCRIAGRLGLFLPDRRAPKIEPYDHENLRDCFVDVIAKIARALKGVESSKVVIIPFTKMESFLQVAVQESWLQADHQLFLGVETELSEGECDEVLKPSYLDRSMGAASQVKILFGKRWPGLTLSTVGRLPRDLPARRGVVFFSIKREEPKDIWAGVLTDRSLAIQFNETKAPMEDDRVSVITPEGRKAKLRFSLYVVPPR